MQSKKSLIWGTCIFFSNIPLNQCMTIKTLKFGEGNGNPLQRSCLGNPTDRGAWQATVHGVTKIRHNWVTNTQTEFLGYWIYSDTIWIYIIICFSKLKECITPTVNPKVNYGLWVIMMCPCRFIFGLTKKVPLWWVMLIMREVMYVWAQRKYEKIKINK